uniref:Putative propionyl-CoA carrier protein transacylase n=1 Tax=Streptomyces griseoloalbus TaxID=67303 RepID=D1H0A7_9ACTN|nr:putative propionyl-CoA carrier protein transacylase [Streptomyces albaduncus]
MTRGRPTALLLPGQGFQHAGMAVEIYRRDRDFADAADAFLAALGPEGDTLRDDWLAGADGDTADRGTRAQPLLFMTGYAVGRTLSRRGVRPDVLIGHSVGELAAAALAGVLDLAAAGRIVAGRCAALEEAPAGGMLAVAGVPERVLDHLRGGPAGEHVVLGAHNGRTQTVLAGPEPHLTVAERLLREAGLVARRVRALEPWHSPAMDRAARRFTEVIGSETLRPPGIPIMSARTGRTVTAAEAVRPAFWAGQIAAPVLFWPALGALLDGRDHLLVDGSPAGGLATLARGHPSVRRGASTVVSLLAPPGRDAWSAWTKGIGQLTAAAV